MRDITAHKQAEEALRRSEERFRRAIAEAPFPAMIHAEDGEVVMINAEWTRVTGYRHDEIPTIEAWTEKAYGDHRAPARAVIAGTYKATGRVDEGNFEIRCRDGAPRIWTFRSTPLDTDATGRRLALSMAVDITEQVAAREKRERLAAQVAAQARQVQAILDTVPQGVLLLDDAGRILHANRVAEQDLAVLAGVQAGDALTHLGERPLAELLTSPPVKGLWHEIKASGCTFEIIARPVEHGAAPERWVLVINDATRERDVQAQLQHQERLAAVGQLAGGIAHDFNNIMAVIILYAGMLARAQGLTEQEREKIAIINQQGWHATRLIQQILDFSRQAVLEQQALDLLPLLKEQVKLLARTLPEHIEITLSHQEAEYVVSADLTRMQQMIMNLALNARDAMPDGGVLHISLDKITVRPGESPLLPEMETGEWIRLTVADTGTGIAPDVLPRIFDPFFTTKAPGEGSGLGLSQVEGLVGQHGGRIGVTTAVGKGTTFTIYLPALTARPVERPTPDVLSMPQGQGEVVLVVEDQAVVRAALVDVLEQLHYQALEAANGEQALAVMHTRGAQVALVVSDVVMPVMGGVRLLHTLRQQGWETPVILLTGHVAGEDFDALRAQGLHAWLHKPPDIEQLAQAIAGALGK
ncbi:MAG: response regulator [Anaerolineae bacterium]|nr:response regulator [Anaerolineae bacterium]